MSRPSLLSVAWILAALMGLALAVGIAGAGNSGAVPFGETGGFALA